MITNKKIELSTCSKDFIKKNFKNVFNELKELYRKDRAGFPIEDFVLYKSVKGKQTVYKTTKEMVADMEHYSLKLKRARSERSKLNWKTKIYLAELALALPMKTQEDRMYFGVDEPLVASCLKALGENLVYVNHLGWVWTRDFKMGVKGKNGEYEVLPGLDVSPESKEGFWEYEGVLPSLRQMMKDRSKVLKKILGWEEKGEFKHITVTLGLYERFGDDWILNEDAYPISYDELNKHGVYSYRTLSVEGIGKPYETFETVQGRYEVECIEGEEEEALKALKEYWERFRDDSPIEAAFKSGKPVIMHTYTETTPLDGEDEDLSDKCEWEFRYKSWQEIENTFALVMLEHDPEPKRYEFEAMFYIKMRYKNDVVCISLSDEMMGKDTIDFWYETAHWAHPMGRKEGESQIDFLKRLDRYIGASVREFEKEEGTDEGD